MPQRLRQIRRTTHAAASAAPPPVARLRSLMTLRAIAVVGQVLAIAASMALDVALPLAPMLAVIALIVALQVAAALRVRREPPVREVEVALHLALDVLAFTALLALAGGAANPFSVFYVLHCTLIALMLPPRAAVGGVVAVIGLYTLLAASDGALRMADGRPLDATLAALGRWLAFILTAGVVGWFVLRDRSLLREHHQLLLAAAQKAHNDEKIVRLGALAAGAAHELSSPLTTMSVVAGELAREATTPAMRRDADVLATQIAACRRTLSNLLAAAGHARAEGGGLHRLDAFLAGAIDRFRALRPEAALEAAWEGPLPAPEVYGDLALEQALLVLLDNAADASPASVRFAARWDDDALRVEVEDSGTGIRAPDAGTLGRVFFTTKPPGRGIGLGLVLAADAVQAHGGTLEWRPRDGGGTSARMVLPLHALRLR